MSSIRHTHLEIGKQMFEKVNVIHELMIMMEWPLVATCPGTKNIFLCDSSSIMNFAGLVFVQVWTFTIHSVYLSNLVCLFVNHGRPACTGTIFGRPRSSAWSIHIIISMLVLLVIRTIPVNKSNEQFYYQHYENKNKILIQFWQQ